MPIFALLVGAAAIVAWPGMRRRPAWPIHLLRGESFVTDLVLGAAVGTIAVARFAGLLLVRDAGGAAVAAVALAITVALTRRRLRSAAAPLLEDAVWLSGLGLAGVLGGAGSGTAFAMGGALAGVVTITLVATLVLLWGRGHHFAVTARPDFQVFAPNPDNRYALGRIRVGSQRHVLAIVPDNENRFTHVSVYDVRMRCVHLVRWPELRDALHERGHLRVHVGTSEVASDADVSVAVPPGRYYLTVRNYVPRDPDDVALPRATSWDGTVAPPWSILEGAS